MFCIICGHETKDESKRFCSKCGNELFREAQSGKRMDPDPQPEMRIYAGSPEFLSRVPKQSPVQPTADAAATGTLTGAAAGAPSNQNMGMNAGSGFPSQTSGKPVSQAASVKANAQGASSLPKHLPSFRVAVTAIGIIAVVTVGVLVVTRLGGKETGKSGSTPATTQTDSAKKSGGLFEKKAASSGKTAYEGVMSGDGNKSDARIFSNGESLYCIQPNGAFIHRIEGKTGVPQKLDNTTGPFGNPSQAGNAIFYLADDAVVKADGASTNVYRFDMDKETVTPVDGLDLSFNSLSSDGKDVYGLAHVKDQGWHVVRIDGKSLKSGKTALPEDWDRDYKDGFLVYGDRMYFHNFDERLENEDPHRYGIRSIDLKTGELAYEEAFGKVDDFCINDEGFAFVQKGTGWFLPHGAAEAKLLLTAEGLDKAYLSDGFVWFHGMDGDASVLYRMKTDGTDQKRILLPGLSDVPADIADGWTFGIEQGAFMAAFRFEGDKATLAVRNVFGIMKEEPVPEEIDVSFEPVK